MSVILSIDEVGPCRKQVKVEVPAPAVEAETQRVVDQFRLRAKIPGFRKGRIPREIVEKKFGEEIQKEVIDRLVPRYWNQAEAESELVPMLPPQVEEVDLQPGSSLTFVASVETRPEIEIGDIDNFDLPLPEIELTDKEVESALDDVRRDLAEWSDVDRPAARGDRVSGELTEIKPDSETAGEPPGEPQSVAFEIGDPQVWEELSLEASGKSADQEAEFVRREGEGDQVRERRFRLRITAVKERELPPADDALAKRVGDFSDLQALKLEIRKRLEIAKNDESLKQRERALADQLRERHPLSLPDGVVDQEVEHMLRDYASGMALQGVDLGKTSLDWQKMAEQVRPQAEERVHARLILDAAAEKLSIEVDEDEFEETLAKLATAQGKTTLAMRRALDQAGRLITLRAQLRREKTVRHLLGDGLSEVEGTIPDVEPRRGENEAKVGV